MRDFRTQVVIMTNLKIYIDSVCKQRDRIDTIVTSYMKEMTSDCDTIEFRDNSLNAAYRIDPILNKLKRHENLQRLTLKNCGIGDGFFERIIELL